MAVWMAERNTHDSRPPAAESPTGDDRRADRDPTDADPATSRSTAADHRRRIHRPLVADHTLLGPGRRVTSSAQGKNTVNHQERQEGGDEPPSSSCPPGHQGEM